MSSSCPRCSGDLSEVHRDTIHLAVCASCGGVWMGGTTLHRFARALHERPEAVAAVKGVADRAVFAFEPDPDELSCPACQAAMDQIRHPTGVTLDVCSAHGVWFDRDELTRVVEDREGLETLDAAKERLAPRTHLDVDGEAVVVGLEIAGSMLDGVDGESVAEVAGASVEVAGGAFELLGGLAGGALELIFDALSNIDLS